MSLSGFLTDQASNGRGLSLGPTAGLTDTIGASFDFTWKAHTTAAAIQYQGAPLNERNDQIKQRFGQDVFDITELRTKYPNPNTEGLARMSKEANERIDDWILKGRTEAPDKYKGIKTTREITDEARKMVDISENHMSEIMTRNPSAVSRFTGGMIGAMGATLLDPPNLLTLPMGAGEIQAGLKGFAAARAILKAAFVDGSINAAVEVANQPAIAEWQKTLGRRYGFGEAAENVGMAFFGGAGISGLIRGFGRGLGYAGSVSSNALDKIAESARLPASVREAARFMSRQAYIDESAPPGSINSGEDLRAHRDTAQRAVEDFENYRPADLSSVSDKIVPSKKASAGDAPSTQALPSQTSDFSPPSGAFTTRAMTPPSNRTGGTVPSKARMEDTPSPSEYHSVANLATLQKRAKALEPELKNFLDAVAQSVEGAKLYGVRVKTDESLALKRGRGKELKNISDFVGGRIVVDSPEAMAAIAARIRDSADVIEFDNMLMGKPSGYRALHMQVMSDKGVSAEIQIQPAEIRAVQDKAHVLYKKWQNEKITPANKAAYLADAQAAKQMFDDAWSAYQGRTGAKDTFTDMMPPERMTDIPKLEDGAEEITTERAAMAENDLKNIVEEIGDETIALDDGSVVSIKEYAEQIQGKKNLIEAMKTCRVA